MLKRFAKYISVAVCFAYAHNALAELRGMGIAEFMAEADKDTAMQQRTRERIGLLDVNQDGKISYNEMQTSIAGVMEIPDDFTSAPQKQELQSYIPSAFSESDNNSDNSLTGEEIDTFSKKMQMFMVRQQFINMDKNQDGIINKEDMPSPDESMKKMEEALKKLQDTIDKLDEIDPEQLAEGMLQNISKAAAEEDYYQMDKNKDNCVNMEEYLVYQLAQDKEDELDKMTYVRWYIDIKKKNKDCMTKSEYVAEMGRPIEDMVDAEEDAEAEQEYAAILFNEIDSNKDGKVTATEYSEYMLMHDKIETNEDNEREYFKEIEGSHKGYLTKEEYCAEYKKRVGEEIKCIGFEDIDEDRDNQISEDEYIKYNLAIHNDKERKKEMYTDMFMREYAPERGWVTQEEFIKRY